jgi:rhamnose transport system substrate-binding protein
MSEAVPQTETRTLKLTAPWRERVFPNNEWVLLVVILAECAVFSLTGSNFLGSGNAFEITRLAVEIGLLALALTPIIITGGIDLSVGSMMGLAAVVLGALWRDAHLPMPVAIGLTLCVGALGGLLNALIITRLNFPPLIVTLGTFSLFRGVAEGLTRGVENYSGFSGGFLFLGQGYVGGLVPTQLFILAAAAVGVWWWLQRTAYGRSLYAIGYSAEGARYAGIPVRSRLTLIYVLSGLASSLAAVVYVAHLGQAKSDAGTGYELMAITAVVLGGASIFGGRGTILGTMLGLFGIVILQNGLRLSAQPAELAGILTGVLLVATILLDRLSTHARTRPARTHTFAEDEEVRNSQVAVLSAVILLGALIVAGSNWMLVRSVKESAGAGVVAGTGTPGSGAAQPAGGKKAVVALMPKAKGDPYFVSCKASAFEA